MTKSVDVSAARAAWIELGKAIDSAEFQSPESTVWQGRAAKTLTLCAIALDVVHEVRLWHGHLDTAHLEKVAKLAYQFKFRFQSVFMGGTAITPFWDAIDALPSELRNEAYAEMKPELDAAHKDG